MPVAAVVESKPGWGLQVNVQQQTAEKKKNDKRRRRRRGVELAGFVVKTAGWESWEWEERGVYLRGIDEEEEGNLARSGAEAVGGELGVGRKSSFYDQAIIRFPWNIYFSSSSVLCLWCLSNGRSAAGLQLRHLRPPHHPASPSRSSPSRERECRRRLLLVRLAPGLPCCTGSSYTSCGRNQPNLVVDRGHILLLQQLRRIPPNTTPTSRLLQLLESHLWLQCILRLSRNGFLLLRPKAELELAKRRAGKAGFVDDQLRLAARITRQLGTCRTGLSTWQLFLGLRDLM